MNVLLFDLHQHRYAVPAAVVVEIVRAVALVPVVGAPRGVEGVFSLRGRIIPVVDVRTRLGLPVRQIDPSQHFIVVTLDGHQIALRVDRTDSLLTIDDARIASSIEGLRHPVSAAHAVAGVVTLDDGLVILYDVNVFLSSTETSALVALLESADDTHTPDGMPSTFPR